MIEKNQSICIIGAGSTGIAACKNFHQAGLDFICYEASDQIGGNWVYKNKNQMSSAYKSLHINTSREKMEYSDFPMPDSFPDFPHHSDIAKYFNDYVDHFGFRDKIKFNTSVVSAILLEDESWQISTSDGVTNIYDNLVVANGHHWDPRYPNPDFKGKYSGETMHSHHYLEPHDPVDCVGKNIVIVGAGNSAMDIACELSRKNTANKVFLAVRSPVWITPKYFGSTPLDSFQRHPSIKANIFQKAFEKIFGFLADFILTRRVIKYIGRPEDIGLPKPSHKFTQAHPTISSEIQLRIGSGDLIIKPNIDNFNNNTVTFDDGSKEEIDVIIYATGYKISFPFFSDSFLKVKNNDIALYKRIFHPQYSSLFFLGLVQPLCAMMPIADEQSKLLTSYLKNTYKLPSQEVMKQDAESIHNEMKDYYVDSPRHTIQINCLTYTDDLRDELKLGSRRL